MKKIEIPIELTIKWVGITDEPTRCQDIARHLGYDDYYDAFHFIRDTYDSNVFTLLKAGMIKRVRENYGKVIAEKVYNLTRGVA